MADTELAAIRAKRLAELQNQNPQTQQRAPNAEDAQKQQQQEEMRKSILLQILDNSARERLNRISIVKPDRARSIEDLIIRMARSGQLRERLNEDMLVGLLEKMGPQQQETKVVVQRRRADEESDEEDYGF